MDSRRLRDSILPRLTLDSLELSMAALFGGIGLFTVSETSAARILQIRAKKLRYETENWTLHAKADEHQITAHTILTVYLVRLYVMIVQEPNSALVTAYISLSAVRSGTYLISVSDRWCHILIAHTVPHVLPRQMRLVSRRQHPTHHLLHHRPLDGSRTHGLLHRHQLQARIYQVPQIHSRRTFPTHGHRSFHPTHYLFLVGVDQ